MLNLPQIGNGSVMIFSVSGTEYGTLTNDIRENELHHLLRVNNILFRRILGKYEGFVETSYIVDIEHKDLILDFIKDYNQESYLITHDDLSSVIIEIKSGNVIDDGVMTKIQEEDLNEYDSWSYDPHERQHWVMK